MSSTETKSATSGGTSIAGLLGIVFIVLKLTGVIAWPWLWVLAPFWIPIALFVVVMIVIVIVAVLK